MNLDKILEQKNKQTYYQILEVEDDISTSALRKARRTLISAYHPDKHPQEDKAIATELSSKINDAFEALSDDDFRQRYDKSGKTIHYTLTGNTARLTKIEKAVDNRTKGYTLTTMVGVDKDILRNGGTTTVTPIPIPGLDIKINPVEVTIDPHTKVGSFLIYKGKGEQVASGNNGDLLIMVRNKNKLTNEETILQNMGPTVSLIPLTGIQKGVSESDLNGTLTTPIQLHKLQVEDDTPSLLYIREVSELKSPLLIQY